MNLAERTDRRRQTVAELDRLGLSVAPEAIEFVEAIRPSSRGEFPSIGARGCFESHHALIKRARTLNLPRVLIMEDDVEFACNSDVLARALDELETLPWDFAYFGHKVDVRSPDPNVHWVRYRRNFETAHCYALSGTLLPALDLYLDDLLERQPDHPDGGPMHIDGAYADFRAYHPETMTYLAAPSLVRQRSTLSDIHPRRIDAPWIPKSVVSGLRGIRRVLLRLSARHRR